VNYNVSSFHEYEIEYYEKANGFCPFAEWLDLQPERVQQRILAGLNRIRAGNFSDSKSVGKGISELRLHFGPGYRVYYKRSGEKIIIIFCAGEKSTQKDDIKRAKEFASEL